MATCYICGDTYSDPVREKAWAESGRAYDPTDWVCPVCLQDERDAIPAAPSIYYGVICPQCGPVQMDRAEYNRQMARPNALWTCPKCGHVAQWDDDRYESSEVAVEQWYETYCA